MPRVFLRIPSESLYTFILYKVYLKTDLKSYSNYEGDYVIQ